MCSTRCCNRRCKPTFQLENLGTGTGTGTGCASCKNTISLIEQAAKVKRVAITLSKVEDMRDIVGFGVMSTPGVVIDGKVMHAGGVPSRDKIEAWLVP